MGKLNGVIRNTQHYIGLPLLHEHWYVAGLTEEFGRDPMARTLLEKSIVFYRTEAGELVALQNRCLHRSYPLSESTLSGDNIVCGYHGIEYSPQGEIKSVPCQTQCPRGKLRKYPTKELGPLVFIWMGSPDNADESKLPDLRYLENTGYLSIYDAKYIEGNYLLMQDNLNDLTHFIFIHANTFGAAENSIDETFLEHPVEYEERNGVTGCYRIIDNTDLVQHDLSPDQRAVVGDRKLRNRNGGVSHAPGVWLGENFVYVDNPAPGHPECYRSYINHFVTPEKHDTCHYWYSITSDFMKPDPEFAAASNQFVGAAFEEDVVAVNHMQKLLAGDRSEHKEISINGDRSAVLFRRKILDWVLEEYPELAES